MQAQAPGRGVGQETVQEAVQKAVQKAVQEVYVTALRNAMGERFRPSRFWTGGAHAPRRIKVALGGMHNE